MSKTATVQTVYLDIPGTVYQATYWLSEPASEHPVVLVSAVAKSPWGEPCPPQTVVFAWDGLGTVLDEHTALHILDGAFDPTAALAGLGYEAN